MSITDTYVRHEPSGAARCTETADRPYSAAMSKAAIRAGAARRIRHGKRLVVGGFVVAILGIVGYCAACFSAATVPELGMAFLDGSGWFVGLALGVIGLGTLLWLAGAFIYVSGGMDSDLAGPDLYF